ncbi:class I SAM-dependent methyltransferase [Butyrivibrio fibrisolvens]|uniref:class I SAM-dependent methyltransferase n=1 Tax=Pseudobutyrivibrio ruminis TaxID=46206 RepID=UPI00041ECFF9|nr:class I SAM-dependent methyltransferase [Pseudobutyrivibrio ruminis]MDC7280617.1 class I SAM-dependent methyltransferase [Butyrivibrio fibrisolvens]
MEGREKIVNEFYAQYVEDNRLDRTRRGQMEYFTTMHYIHQYLKPGMKVVEIGAGTGRLSLDLAKEGYDVTAVEYTDANFEKLQKNAESFNDVTAIQGDAVNLHQLEDSAYDVTLLFGPMYHLYSEEEQLAALKEASRITKPEGKVFIAFISVYAIMYTNYLIEQCGDMKVGMAENYTEDYQVKHFPKQLFTGFDITEFEELVDKTPLKRIKTLATDGVIELVEMAGGSNFNISDENFEVYKKYHLAMCEKRELLGSSNHLIVICDNK